MPRSPPAQDHGRQAGTHGTRSSLGHRLGYPSGRRQLTTRQTPAAQDRPGESGEQRQGHHTQ